MPEPPAAGPAGGVRRLADLPFVERDPLDLLHLRAPADAPDPDYAGFGWAIVPALRLSARDEAVERALARSLVLGLHAADDGAALADDVELEFVLADGAVIAPLSAFLRAWLPRLPAAPAIVLALCNPHRAALARPAAAGAAEVHYGLGDVASWLDRGGALRLTADSWRMAAAP